jgi:hypothetical protein
VEKNNPFFSYIEMRHAFLCKSKSATPKKRLHFFKKKIDGFKMQNFYKS